MAHICEQVPVDLGLPLDVENVPQLLVRIRFCVCSLLFGCHSQTYSLHVSGTGQHLPRKVAKAGVVSKCVGTLKEAIVRVVIWSAVLQTPHCE